MRPEKELERIRHILAKHLPNMSSYKDYEVYNQHILWLYYAGLLETRYIISYRKLE